MKRNYILSGILGGVFFSVSFLALNISLLPSLGAAAVAFVAGSFITKKDPLFELGLKNQMEYQALLEESKKDLSRLYSLIKELNDKDLRLSVAEINNIASDIIKLLDKEPKKISQATNFLNYYLPITLQILTKYMEMEDENINSKERRNVMERIRSLITKIKIAFEKQLDNLYSTEMIDINAEIKVFEASLISDGLLGEKIDKEGSDTYE